MQQYQKPVIIQQQKLKLSPQLFQSIQLMALPIQDLKTRIQEEIEKNPALEMIEDKSEVSLEQVDTQKDEIPEEDYFANSSDPGRITSGPVDQEASDKNQNFIEGALTRSDTLQDHLLWQLRLHRTTEQQRKIGELLIKNLDNNGFHMEDPVLLVLDEEIPILKEMITLIQTLDPVGVCVSDYKESLLVQISQRADAPDIAVPILNHHLKDLDRGKYREIARTLRTSPAKVEEIRDFFKTLNPFPGSQFTSEVARYVIPDLVIKIKDGEFVIVLNDEEIPVLGVNTYFEEMSHLNAVPEAKEAKQYAQKHVKDARWFINSIHQRNRTLLKIAKAIVEYQRNFFIKGPKSLVPLTLKDIADEVGVHETTVSRISNSKYCETEWGIFELKYFFTNSISGTGSGGSRFSKEGVKAVIKEILEDHESTKKLSDQKISDLLKQRGISIARRTVAKYRNELDIDSSFGR